MIYTATSMKEVIGRVVRNTGLRDATLLAGMVEWIPEAMGLMKTKAALVTMWKDLEIEFHKSQLPCTTRSVLGAADHCGHRMKYYKGIRSADETCVVPGTTGAAGDTLFSSTITFPLTATEDGGRELVTSLTLLGNTAYGKHTYYVEMGWFNTSLSDGTVRVFYNSIPVDDDGLPMIPDNEQYKQAIYWYVRSMLIGAGYNDPVFKWDVCEAKFDKHAAKAVGEIRYPSPDQMETSLEFTRLVPPQGYFESFYGNPGKEPDYV